jgi:PPM family protein phosphatase
MEVAVTSDAGHGSRNEDAWCAEQLHRNVTLLAVADGFGKIQGACAASATLDTINESVRTQLQAAMPPRSLTGSDVRDILISAFAAANDRLLRASGGSDDAVNAASTCTAVLMVSNQAFIAHVGDSRAYLFRRGELVQLTSDESLTAEFVTSSSGISRYGRYRPVRPVLMRDPRRRARRPRPQDPRRPQTRPPTRPLGAHRLPSNPTSQSQPPEPHRCGLIRSPICGFDSDTPQGIA